MMNSLFSFHLKYTKEQQHRQHSALMDATQWGFTCNIGGIGSSGRVGSINRFGSTNGTGSTDGIGSKFEPTQYWMELELELE